jgi:sterol desaturase/sphingolipid hydroxylase (fatty acid hydroxylase superfamily)
VKTLNRPWRAIAALALVAMLGAYALSKFSEVIAKALLKATSWNLAAEIAAFSLVPAIVLIPLMALAIEVAWIGWDRSCARKLAQGNRHSWRDFLYCSIAMLPVGFIAKVALTFGVIWLSDKIVSPEISFNLIGYLPTWPLQYVAVVVLGSFCQYWQHRILHAVPALWETHKFHHSAQEMTILNTNRESPFTTGVADLVTFVPLAIFGVLEARERGGDLGPVDLFFMAVFFAYATADAVNRYVVHSEIRTTYGWLGDWLFISPNAHRVHHSTLPQFWNKNFSTAHPWWDRLFGTWERADSEEAMNTPIGYVGNIYNQGSALTDYLWLPMREFGRYMVRAIRHRSPRPPSAVP